MSEHKQSRETAATYRQASKAWHAAEQKMRRHIDLALAAKRELDELSRILRLDPGETKSP